MSMGRPDSWTYRITELGKVAGAFTTIAAALTLLWGITVGPLGQLYDRFNDTVEAANTLQREQSTLQAQQQDILSSLTDIVEDQTELLTRVKRLEDTRETDSRPALRFDRSGHTVSDTAIGGIAVFKWRFFKLRDCARPSVDLVFRNGEERLHRFENISVLDSSGRGITFETAPNRMQEIGYTALLPSDDGVIPGHGQAWVTVSYPESCPSVAPVTSPEVSFEILPEVRK